MKNYIFIILFMCSCSKNNTAPVISQPVFSQIDHIIFRSVAANQETIAKVHYDDLGRITQFGNESYLYNTKHQVNHIALYIPDERSAVNNIMIRQNYKVDYDQKIDY